MVKRSRKNNNEENGGEEDANTDAAVTPTEAKIKPPKKPRRSKKNSSLGDVLHEVIEAELKKEARHAQDGNITSDSEQPTAPIEKEKKIKSAFKGGS